VKDGEERWFVAFVDSELAGDQAYVCCGPRESLALLFSKSPEDRNRADLLRRYQGKSRVRAALDADPKESRAPALEPSVMRRSATVSDKSGTATSSAWKLMEASAARRPELTAPAPYLALTWGCTLVENR
jgi:hypothetical protein